MPRMQINTVKVEKEAVGKKEHVHIDRHHLRITVKIMIDFE